MRLFVAVFISLFLLAACGQKGPLYLPKKESATATSLTVVK